MLRNPSNQQTNYDQKYSYYMWIVRWLSRENKERTVIFIEVEVSYSYSKKFYFIFIVYLPRVIMIFFSVV